MDSIAIKKRIDESENLFIDIFVDGVLYETHCYESLSIQHEEDFNEVFNAIMNSLKAK